MADEYDDTDDGIDDQADNANIRQLREKAKRADELEARVAQMEKDAAFTKALGPSVEEARVKDYFIPAYKGEMTPDAIRAAATEAGFLQQATPPPAGQTVDPTNDRIAAASQGAGEPAPPDLHAAINAATSEEEVLAILEAAGVPTTRTSQ